MYDLAQVFCRFSPAIRPRSTRRVDAQDFSRSVTAAQCIDRDQPVDKLH
jgi:hypothetical protein